MINTRIPGARRHLLLALGLVAAPSASAYQFELDIWDGIEGSLNTSLTLGAAWRLEEREDHLIGKANLDPGLCPVKSCQGIYQGDVEPNQARLDTPGAYSNNIDDGNLNYDQYDLVQGVGKVLSELKLSYADFGLFVRGYGFYDQVNVDFREYHPNRIVDGTPATGPAVLESASRDGAEELLGVPLDPPLVPGMAGENGPPTYGPGEIVRNERTGSALRDQVGTDLKLLDAYAYGFFPYGERELTLKLGRQSINWGESVLLVINSLNQVNPPNLNHLFRVGLDLVEIFEPVGSLYASTGITDFSSVEMFYQYEWQPIMLPGAGSFLSFIDVGTNDVVDRINVSFGSAAESFSDGAAPLDNVLAAVTNTTLNVRRLPDKEPEDGGQFGLALKYYADWLNDGTELGLYAMNYHSRLPYVSFYATDASCAKREGSASGADATDTATLLAACPDLPLNYHLSGEDPAQATSDVLPLDTARMQLEYPEDIQMYGVSFNTSFGELALQGEVTYRPELPIQVDAEDLAFAAFQPTLTRCSPGSSSTAPCSGTQTSGPNTLSLLAPAGGDLPGAARSFPSYVLPYRNQPLEELAPNSYIRGWETFENYQFNLGGTYVLTPKMLGLSQFLFLFEIGAQYVPGLPGPCELPLEAPGTYTHPSAGADGTGTAEGGGRVCHPQGSDVRSNADGTDGLRFNPTQQLSGYPDELSSGYRLIMIPRWDSILPGISIEPIIIFGHDVYGTSPGPGESFLEGRQQLLADINIRWKSLLQFHVGYNMFWGAEPYNPISDRDFASVFVRYAF